VARPAGPRNIQRIHRRPRIVLRNNLMRIPVTACARMLRSLVHASRQPRSLVRVARRALHPRDLVRMRIALDCRVAVRALETSVNARMKLRSIHSDTVPRCVLHACIGMTGQTLRAALRQTMRRTVHQCTQNQGQRNSPGGLHRSLLRSTGHTTGIEETGLHQPLPRDL